MTKQNLGTKRLCGSCDTKFYDLERDPIVCPKCGATFVPEQPAAKPEIKAKAAPVKKPVEKDETEELDDEDAELVSLEDADEEASDSKSIPDLDDVDVDLDDDDDDDNKDDDDNTFLEDDDEDGPNLSDIVGGVKPDDDD